jgi:hypothetical protein
VEAPLAAVLGVRTAELEICQPDPAELPSARLLLPQPARAGTSMRLTVHSRAGIPLASAIVNVRPGDLLLESSSMALLAMEGYTHLARRERQLVERRVWSRCAFATASTVK